MVFLQVIARLLREWHDLVVAVIEGWAGEIVHRGIDDYEILHAGLLHVLDARDENTGIAGDEPARLDQDP